MCISRNIVPVIVYLLSIKLQDESCPDYHVVIETVATVIAVCQRTAFSGIHTSCTAAQYNLNMHLHAFNHVELLYVPASRNRRPNQWKHSLCYYAGCDNSTATNEKLQLCRCRLMVVYKALFL